MPWSCVFVRYPGSLLDNSSGSILNENQTIIIAVIAVIAIAVLALVLVRKS